MIEARLIIEIPGLESLAAAIAKRNAQQPELPPAAPVTPAPTSAVYAQQVVPTSPPPSFTAEQIGRAGAAMLEADPAKHPALMALLQQFGVPAIALLQPDQLGPFATALRGLGANI